MRHHRNPQRGLPPIVAEVAMRSKPRSRERPSMRIDDLPELAQVPEVASVLRCSNGMVYELIRSEILPAIRLGRLVRIHRDAVREARNGERGDHRAAA